MCATERVARFGFDKDGGRLGFASGGRRVPNRGVRFGRRWRVKVAGMDIRISENSEARVLRGFAKRGGFGVAFRSAAMAFRVSLRDRVGDWIP